ncbi:hypothetical protein J3E64_003491 [Sphingobium sp. OAS761]|uniref:ThuA domain-containing protein n=1 Tax=Sphingobium sp. OAS761 TaxID=2817901 RepID=UPI00209C84F9|nr:ThuA domain-containing protein [Sphingobium sp. OAS761]MCP1471778.1 hypothetical protein [Sphingobium sp. OAS761]
MAALLLLAGIGVALNWDLIRQTALGGYHDHDTVAPALPAGLHRPAILVFSKTNAFRHVEAIPAANELVRAIAARRGWSVFVTENGAAFEPSILSHFDAIMFNNATGDIFTPAQQAALRAWMESGGSFVGLHAAGDGSIPWPWYRERVIGAAFVGHPMNPQFQPGLVRFEDRSHPATRTLPARLSRTDEWYHFQRSPRHDVHVLAVLDEASLANRKIFGRDLSMGSDHPIAWWRCAGKGRVFYTAMGHRAESYDEPAMRAMIAGALDWAVGREAPACP